MKFSQETLMAYADGELDAQTRREIEAAMATDPQVAEQVARHRRLRDELGCAFDGVLDEPVPDRLLAAANASPDRTAGKVVDLADLRAAKARSGPRRRWSWPEWTSIAASLLVGVVLGRAAMQSSQSDLFATEAGRVVATGALAAALAEQAGGSTDESAVDIGLSFRSKSGEYCRTFTAAGNGGLAGFACRETDRWRVHALLQADPKAAGGDYRMAGAQLPSPVMRAVEQTIEGDALDEQEEAAARERGWRP